MVANKEDYVSAAIRKQILSLEALLKERCVDKKPPVELHCKLRAVEAQLKHLRDELQPNGSPL